MTLRAASIAAFVYVLTLLLAQLAHRLYVRAWLDGFEASNLARQRSARQRAKLSDERE